jgi:hypothetical protein
MSRSRREKATLEYQRVLRIAAGAVEGKLSPRVEKFCKEAFHEWEKRVEELQMRLVREVGQFFLSTQRLMDLRDAREVYLYRFLARIRHRVRTGGLVYPKCIKYLDRYVHGWMVDREELETIQLLQSAMAQHQFDSA